jgi:hypothetical protein
MTQLALDRPYVREEAPSQWARLRRIAGWAALAQLLCLLVSTAVSIAIGAEPATAQEYFDALQANRLVGLLRLDFPTMIMICLFSITSFGVFAALRRTATAYAALGTALVYVGVVLALANHSALSMIRLSDLHAAAATAAAREQLLVAANAVIAADMWRSTSGFLAGIFMQGGFVLMSASMLGGSRFSRWTAITGLVANGLDFLHVFVALVAPQVATALLFAAGPFYLAWFPLLARDLLRRGEE